MKAVKQAVERDGQKPKPKRRPQIHTQYYYSLSDADDTTIGSCTVVPRHGTRFIVNLWVKGSEREQGYARELLMRAIEEWGHEDLWLHVASFTDRAFSDEDLIAFYATFGFNSTRVPGAMHRPGNLK